jgi:hypothetical protein
MLTACGNVGYMIAPFLISKVFIYNRKIGSLIVGGGGFVTSASVLVLHSFASMLFHTKSIDINVNTSPFNDIPIPKDTSENQSNKTKDDKKYDIGRVHSTLRCIMTMELWVIIFANFMITFILKAFADWLGQ